MRERVKTPYFFWEKLAGLHLGQKVPSPLGAHFWSWKSGHSETVPPTKKSRGKPWGPTGIPIEELNSFQISNEDGPRDLHSEKKKTNRLNQIKIF